MATFNQEFHDAHKEHITSLRAMQRYVPPCVMLKAYCTHTLSLSPSLPLPPPSLSPSLPTMIAPQGAQEAAITSQGGGHFGWKAYEQAEDAEPHYQGHTQTSRVQQWWRSEVNRP